MDGEARFRQTSRRRRVASDRFIRVIEVLVVSTDAQTAVGGTQGMVVGHTDADLSGAMDPKIIVAIDASPPTNTVLDPRHLGHQDASV